MAAALTSLTLRDCVLRNYGGEGIGCRIARGLFALEFLSLLMSHRSRPTLEAEGARIATAAARAVRSLMNLGS